MYVSSSSWLFWYNLIWITKKKRRRTMIMMMIRIIQCNCISSSLLVISNCFILFVCHYHRFFFFSFQVWQLQLLLLKIIITIVFCMGVMKIQSKKKIWNIVVIFQLSWTWFIITTITMMICSRCLNGQKKNFNQPEQHCVITPFFLFFSGCRLDLISSDRWKKNLGVE